jgi:hypothetical protein
MPDSTLEQLLLERMMVEQPSHVRQSSDPMTALSGASTIGPSKPSDRALDLPTPLQEADPFMKVINLIGMGGNDALGNINPAAQAILPLTSPLRNPAVRKPILEGLVSTAKAAFSPNIAADVEAFTQKYPRLASHLKSVEPVRASDRGLIYQPVEDIATFSPVSEIQRYGPDAHLAPGHLENPRGAITLNAELPHAAPSLAHEGTHLAQQIRLSDRARQAERTATERAAAETQNVVNSALTPYATRLAPGGAELIPTEIKQGAPMASEVALEDLLKSGAHQTPFMEKYKTLLGTLGYFDHPMEQTARTTAVLSTLPKTPGIVTNRARREVAESIAKNPATDREWRRFIDPNSPERQTLRSNAKRSNPNPEGVFERPSTKSVFEVGQNLLRRFGTKQEPSLKEMELFVAQASKLKNLSPLELDTLNKAKGRLRLLQKN